MDARSEKFFYSSLTRIADLRGRPFEVQPVPRSAWETGDYVVGRVRRPPRGLKSIELATGRATELVEDDLVIGAFGERFATLEAVGRWHDVGADGEMEALTSAGLFGRATSVSTMIPSLLPLRYTGHVCRDGDKLTMRGCVAAAPDRALACPTVLLVGTSMSAGKTTTAKAVIRQLKRRGLRVVGCKLSGAGRYRDILGMRDAGADEVFDFVDVGLPSTIGPRDRFEADLRGLLARIAAAEPDVVVAEAGASPLEPYNGEAVVQTLGPHLRCTILCASDPYAVVGVMAGFQLRPDLVAGLATSTAAGVALVEKLTGIPALNVLDPGARDTLDGILAGALA